MIPVEQTARIRRARRGSRAPSRREMERPGDGLRAALDTVRGAGLQRGEPLGACTIADSFQ